MPQQEGEAKANDAHSRYIWQKETRKCRPQVQPDKYYGGRERERGAQVNTVIYFQVFRNILWQFN